MKRIAGRAASAALASVALTASLTVAVPQAAYAIDVVQCGNSEFAKILWHIDYLGTRSGSPLCFANAGEYDLDREGTEWLDKIWTGNNRVQWYGDGKWQPATPIGKRTSFSWPNHPGGVKVDKIRIL